MAIEDATFVVQVEANQFSCLGKDIPNKVGNNLMICQDGEDYKSIQPLVEYRIWSNWVYDGKSNELPRYDHPAKKDYPQIDYSWIDVKDSHDRGPGSTSDFAAMKALQAGDVLYWDDPEYGGQLTVVQDVYVWGSERCSIKLDFEPHVEDGQDTMNIYALEIQPVPDDILFIVTDGDNGHKSVTGAQFKELFLPSSPSFPDPVLGGLIPGEIITVTNNQCKVGAYSWWTGQSNSGSESGNVTGVDVYCWPNGLDPLVDTDKFATLKVLEVDQMYEDGGMRERTLPSKMEVQKCPHSGFDSGTNQFVVMEDDGSIPAYSSWCELTTDWPVHT